MTNDYTRRDFLATATAGAALASLSSNSLAETESDLNTVLSSAFNTVQEIKPLPFDPAKLDGISEKLIRSHWENNYAGSIKALNAVKQKLAGFLEDSTLPPYIYNDLKREHLIRTLWYYTIVFCQSGWQH
ncbi:twin-arginine translocation signal domain-containing protein [Methylomonas methanica]|uniref:twin-arginine translocation signal domain-containing protein n=1 Tax=Methylomonas methanica TaxID=421 RepID=UPI000AB386FE|nr:twin-arginine translocation signal domain-containing protein [Methylomonas methanica]